MDLSKMTTAMIIDYTYFFSSKRVLKEKGTLENGEKFRNCKELNYQKAIIFILFFCDIDAKFLGLLCSECKSL